MSREAFLYTIAAFARNMTALLSGIAVLRWVAPEQLGIWQTLLLAQIYLGVLRLGIVNGMNRELAFRLGSNDPDGAGRLAATAQACVLACAAVAVLIMGGGAAFVWPREAAWRLPLVAMSLIVPLDLYYGYLEGTFRTHFDFGRLARIYIATAALSLLSVALVIVWGFDGYCYRAVLLSALQTTLAFIFRPIRVRPHFDRAAFLTLQKTGLPLFGQNYLHQVTRSLDRLAVLSIGSAELLGCYGPSLAVTRVITGLSDALNTYLSPRLSYRFGQTGRRAALFRPAMQSVAVSILGALPLAVAGWFALPYLVGHLFPQYLPGLFAMRMALLTGLFLNARIAMAAPCMMKAWRFVVLEWLLGFVLKGGLLLGAVHAAGTLDGVAAVNTLAAALAAGAVVYVVRRATTDPAPPAMPAGAAMQGS